MVCINMLLCGSVSVCVEGVGRERENISERMLKKQVTVFASREKLGRRRAGEVRRKPTLSVCALSYFMPCVPFSSQKQYILK